MHGQTSDVVGVRFKRDDLLMSVVIEDAKLEVVRARDKPVLAWNEAYATHGHLRDFECLDDRTCLMIVDVHGTVVETCEQPWLRGVEVDALDAVGATEQLPL